jgi:hypothetical protein
VNFVSKIDFTMKTKTSEFVFKFAILMFASSVVLFGGYLTKCIPDPGFETGLGNSVLGASCVRLVSTCNECVDGWLHCFGSGTGSCVITRLQGVVTPWGCLTLRTSTTPSIVKCSL